MSKEKAEQVLKMLVALAENYGAELSKARTRLILSELDRFELDDIRRGMTKIMREHKGGFPTLAHMIEAIQGRVADRFSLEADKQWLCLWRAVSAGAFHPNIPDVKPEDYLDSVALVVLRIMGGADALNTWKSAELHWRRKEWNETYTRLAGDQQKLLELADQAGVISSELRALAAKVGQPMPILEERRGGGIQ